MLGVDAGKGAVSTASGVGERGRRPPGPGGLGLGRLVKRVRDGLGFYGELRARYGDAVYFRILHRRFCVLFDPELIGEVLAEKEAWFEKGPAFKKTLVVKNPTTLTADGDDHRRLRALVQPSFGRARLMGYAEEMVAQAVKVSGGWSPEEVFDLVAVTRKFATAVVSGTFFGRDIGVEARLLEDTIKALRWSMALTLVPFGGGIARLPLRPNRFLQAVCRRMDRVIEQAIAKAVMPENLDQVAPTTAENVQIPRMWVVPEVFLDLERERVHAAPHVRHPRRQPYADAARNRDHRRARTERTRPSAAPSTSRSTITRDPCCGRNAGYPRTLTVNGGAKLVHRGGVKLGHSAVGSLST